MISIRDNYDRILQTIHKAAVRSGRSPETIQLIAVTKTVSPAHVREAIEAGVRQIGENRLQEALPKREELLDLAVTWHFIGHRQTNKARKVVENFDWVQCVDRPEVDEDVNQAATKRFAVLTVV